MFFYLSDKFSNIPPIKKMYYSTDENFRFSFFVSCLVSFLVGTILSSIKTLGTILP